MILPENPYKFQKRNGMIFQLNKVWQEGSQATAKAIVEWGYETCPHSRGDFRDADEPVTQCYKHACDLCWQQLKQEIQG